MNYCVEVTVDTNDADYVTEVFTLSDKELDVLRPFFVEIKRRTEEARNNNVRNFYNYPSSEYISETPEKVYPDFTNEVDWGIGWDPCSLIEVFEELCKPMTEYGFHTIKSVKVYPEVEKEELV
jgi:hypothetical protein